MSQMTPLFEQHQLCGAKMVDFHGWQLPLHYGSQLKEHQAVRQDVGMFDVSHMTIVDLLGAGGRQFLRYLLANDVDRLAHTGKAMYSCMLNQHGGVLDDLIVYHRASDNYRLILNSATRDKDLEWIRQHTNHLALGIQERPDLAILAIQGPKAIEKTMRVLGPSQVDAVSTLAPFECVDVQNWFFARTGYTGEDGLEVVVPKTDIGDFWQALVTNGVTPCGLGARDSLRLEAGMMLYGQDMDENSTPLETALSWSIGWEPQDRDFIGRTALELQREQGLKRKMVGLILQDKGIMRNGQAVYNAQGEEGVITSGGFSPSLQQSIALARVPAATKDYVEVDIRGKRVKAKLTKPRFVKNGKAI